tara:strand:- start:3722 stop:4192 length:471 start_codon:yes stop_codon:yes gene_type:complete
MSLKKVNSKTVLQLMESTIKSFALFDSFELKRSYETVVRSPSIRTNYDLIFESKLNDRWFFIRIEDHYKYQKLIIWVNKLEHPEPVNFSLERYLAGYTKLNIGEDLWLFKIKTEKNLVVRIQAVINIILHQNLEEVIALIKGKSWMNMPFDWEGYK